DQKFVYNRVRKPIDLYMEHLTALDNKMPNTVRWHLVPLLQVPLDNMILNQRVTFCHKGTPILSDCPFSIDELGNYALTPDSTFGDIEAELVYRSLQTILASKAIALTKALEDICAKSGESAKSFHPIYFDLLWGDRYRNQGLNLREV